MGTSCLKCGSGMSESCCYVQNQSRAANATAPAAAKLFALAAYVCLF